MLKKIQASRVILSKQMEFDVNSTFLRKSKIEFREAVSWPEMEGLSS
jgi:hypothetical protein